MTSLKHTCGSCDSEFTIEYDDMQTDSDPIICPFCGEYLVLEDDDFVDDE